MSDDGGQLPSVTSLFLFFPTARARRGGVCSAHTIKKMAPSSSRLLGEVWKNLDDIRESDVFAL